MSFCSKSRHAETFRKLERGGSVNVRKVANLRVRHIVLPTVGIPRERRYRPPEDIKQLEDRVVAGMGREMGDGESKYWVKIQVRRLLRKPRDVVT